MNRFALLIAPVPIIAASFALATWAKHDPHAGATRNEVHTSVVELAAFENVVESQRITEASSASHDACGVSANRLRRKLGPEFTVIVRPPFVLASDVSQVELSERYQRTVLPAFQAMQDTYFRNTADEPITLLLLSDELTYRSYAERLFAQTGVSIYGFYKPSYRTLMINLAAGEGTIVHELTHALIEFDFDDVPLWFNEGLASLHEQCRFIVTDDGTRSIEGLDNWRLPILQGAMEQGRTSSLLEMMRAPDFYGSNEAIHYAQARYFCMYLQHHGLLDKFYEALRDQSGGPIDAAGAIARALPDRTPQNLEAEFENWVFRQSVTVRKPS